MAEKNAWLLTWNPELASGGGYGSPDSSLGIPVDEERDWSCLSQKPKIDDTVYILRQGKEPKGIVAIGVVTKESFLSAKDNFVRNDKREIGIKLSEVRDTCADGLLPRSLLRAAFPDQRWQTQSSGIGIRNEYVGSLGNLWDDGRGKHSLHQFVTWFSELPDYDRRLANHQAIVELATDKADTLGEDDLRKLWKEKNNGFVNVGQGRLTNDFYENNADLLKRLTQTIASDPTAGTYKAVIGEINKARLKDNSMKYVPEAVVRRVFAAADPERYTNIVSSSKCKTLLKVLSTQFELTANTRGKDWFELNAEIKQCHQEAKLDPAQTFPNNMAMWWLYDINSSNDEPQSETSKMKNEQNQVQEPKSLYGPHTPKNLILYGPPGTGKTYETTNRALGILDHDFLKDKSNGREAIKKHYDTLKDTGRIEFVTFHQSFSYEDFVEGLKAQPNEEGGGVLFPIVDGVFKRICERCADDPELRHVLIIDEINRGNIANIFGELITLIEPSKRKGEQEALSVTLPYSKESFSVPSNLYIIGTMNTADRSLVLVDTALRRRFRFVEMMPNTSLLADIEVGGIDIKRMVDAMNQRIELLYDREHTLGHSFFLPLINDGTIDRLASIFRFEILPLLEEYFFEDWSRIQQVLGDNQKPAKDTHFYIDKFGGTNIPELLGDGGDTQATPYERNEKALQNPAAYIGIYDPPASGKQDEADKGATDGNP